MTDDTRDPQDNKNPREEMEDLLDQMPIPEQVAWLEDSVEEAKVSLFFAHGVAQKIVVAAAEGLLKKDEKERFLTTVWERVKDLRAMLVLQWSGYNSELEILEQLHHIYYPRTGLNGGANLTLLDHMYHFRRGQPAIDILTGGAREGMEMGYWDMLRKYLDKHPDEPTGWREVVRKRPGQV